MTGGRAGLPTVGGVISGLVVQGSVRKEAEQAPVHGLRISSYLQVPALFDFLQSRPALWKHKPNQPFPSRLAFWSWCFVAAIETITKTLTGEIAHTVAVMERLTGSSALPLRTLLAALRWGGAGYLQHLSSIQPGTIRHPKNA